MRQAGKMELSRRQVLVFFFFLELANSSSYY